MSYMNRVEDRVTSCNTKGTILKQLSSKFIFTRKGLTTKTRSVVGFIKCT